MELLNNSNFSFIEYFKSTFNKKLSKEQNVQECDATKLIVALQPGPK